MSSFCWKGTKFYPAEGERQQGFGYFTGGGVDGLGVLAGARHGANGSILCPRSQSWIVFTVLTTMLGILSLASEVRSVLSPESMGIFWNAGLAMGLTIVGVQASRILTAGGVALFASAVMANFYPGKVYLLLAAGMVSGMIVPGLILTLQPNRIVPIRSSP